MKNENEKKIFRMCQAYGVSKEYELARKLGVEAHTVSGWKNRGVPKGRILKTSHDTGFAIKYLETGEGEMLVKPKPTTSEPETPYRLGGATTNFTCRNIDFSLLWQAEEILQTDGPLREDLEKTIKELHRQVANYPKNICLPITEKNG